uniref:Uncharacterized protein n=1 Tax=Rhizophagus irregularis (strain DAOM 181602 / DAOM 197198 / MUCL 43194) TaxID=747089 RepID=U9TBG2_RHIID
MEKIKMVTGSHGKEFLIKRIQYNYLNSQSLIPDDADDVDFNKILKSMMKIIKHT